MYNLIHKVLRIKCMQIFRNKQFVIWNFCPHNFFSFLPPSQMNDTTSGGLSAASGSKYLNLRLSSVRLKWNSPSTGIYQQTIQPSNRLRRKRSSLVLPVALITSDARSLSEMNVAEAASFISAPWDEGKRPKGTGLSATCVVSRIESFIAGPNE